MPAAKRVGADLLEFAAPKIGEVISGIKSFKSATKNVGKQTLKKNWEKGAKGGKEPEAYGRQAVNRGESIQQNLLKNPVGRDEIFLQTFLVDHVKQQFSVPTFCGSVWKSWRESPNC